MKRWSAGGQPLARATRAFSCEAQEPLLLAAQQQPGAEASRDAAASNGSGGREEGLGPRRSTWGHPSFERGGVEGSVHALLVLNNIRLVQGLREEAQLQQAACLSQQSSFAPSPELGRLPLLQPAPPPPPPPGDVLLWLCATCLFLYDIFARLQLNVLMPELLGAFETDAATVGCFFGSAWLLSYALMQVGAAVRSPRASGSRARSALHPVRRRAAVFLPA